MKKPRVLVIAEAANPEWVSVPLVGWSMANALRGVADVHLVTHIRNRDAILRAGLKEGEDFTAIDSEAVDRPIWKLGQILRFGKGGGWTTLTAIRSLTYRYFERLVWRRFGAAIRAGEFDIVHRITPLSPALNSPLAWKVDAAGVPFVLGPINGGVPWPRGFDAERRREREWLSYVRDVYKLSPGRKRMLRSTRAILAGSRRTEAELPADCRDRTIHLPENAVDPERFTLAAPETVSEPLRACFVGRLVPLKGVDMLLEAAAPLLESGRLVLDIVGDGPLRQALEDQASAGGYANAVTFHGWLEHRDVQTVLARSNLLAFPSIREFGGGVVLEAMMLGVVPLVIDYGGPRELVTEGTGYKIPITPRPRLIAALRAQLESISAAPEGLPAMGRAARDKAHTMYTWAAKADQLRQVYAWVLNERPDRPDFGFDRPASAPGGDAGQSPL